jgi:cell division septum initiation protein DivIVA
MLLNKIHRLKKKIKNKVNNLDLLDVIIEDSDLLNRKLESQQEEIYFLKNKIKNLEELNVSYSKDIILLSKAVAEQYELLKTIIGYQDFSDDYFLHDEISLKKKKKKIVH